MREQQDKNSSGTRKLKCSNEMWKFEFFGDLCFILLTSPAKRIIFGSVKVAEVVKMLPHFWVVKGTKVGIKNFQRLWNWTTFYLGRDTYLPTYLPICSNMVHLGTRYFIQNVIFLTDGVNPEAMKPHFCFSFCQYWLQTAQDFGPF